MHQLSKLPASTWYLDDYILCRFPYDVIGCDRGKSILCNDRIVYIHRTILFLSWSTMIFVNWTLYHYSPIFRRTYFFLALPIHTAVVIHNTNVDVLGHIFYC